jgi:nucleoid-associated protein YgaU
MMKTKNIIPPMALLLFMLSYTLYSQEQTTAADQPKQQEMTKEQWKQAMGDATTKRDVLKKEVDSLDQEIAKLRTQDSDLAEKLKQNQTAIAAKLDGMKTERDELERQLNDIDSKLEALARLEKQMLLDHEGELEGIASSINEAKSQRLAQLQEYQERIQKEEQQLNELRGMVAKIKTEGRDYVVGSWSKERECLWNIAGKSSVYGDSFLWVKIWQANTKEISNPDIIQPGQHLRIPSKSALTRDEQSALREYESVRSGSGQVARSESK